MSNKIRRRCRSTVHLHLLVGGHVDGVEQSKEQRLRFVSVNGTGLFALLPLLRDNFDFEIFARLSWNRCGNQLLHLFVAKVLLFTFSSR
jgi:hypothetical protein